MRHLLTDLLDQLNRLNMNKQITQCIIQFMLRVNLTGQEVPAFNESMRALQDELDREDSQPPHRVVNATHNESVIGND